MSRRELQRVGELCAAERLLDEGCDHLSMNVHVGRSELDIVAERDGMLIVCEVRATATQRPVLQSVSKRKQRHICRGVEGILLVRPDLRDVRIDVAAVSVLPSGRVHLDYRTQALDLSESQ